MKFEWDTDKERTNLAKHGIDFRTAALVFADNHRIEKFDCVHSVNEDRYITIGDIKGILIAVIVYTERSTVVRIISARAATQREKEEYCHANTNRH